jgi:hypothetical protein
MSWGDEFRQMLMRRENKHRDLEDFKANGQVGDRYVDLISNKPYMTVYTVEEE